MNTLQNKEKNPSTSYFHRSNLQVQQKLKILKFVVFFVIQVFD